MKRDRFTGIEEQAALYALGMLCQTEARAFEYEVAAGNPEAVASLKAFDHLVADLALSVPEATPPASVRKSLINRIAGEFVMG